WAVVSRLIAVRCHRLAPCARARKPVNLWADDTHAGARPMRQVVTCVAAVTNVRDAALIPAWRMSGTRAGNHGKRRCMARAAPTAPRNAAAVEISIDSTRNCAAR